MRVVVLFKDGYEEIEALGAVDILRRAKIRCDLVGMDDLVATSSHSIKIQMDILFNEDVYNADAVILPGGLPGATSLRDDPRVIDLIRDFHEKKKIIAAICAAPIVLEKAGIMEGRHYTCYPGFDKDIVSGIYHDELVCVDEHIITGRGPGASLAFGYKILEHCGVECETILKGMQYHYITK